MDCPRCGRPGVTDPSCPQCGVIFAKIREGRPGPSAGEVRPDAAPPATSSWGLVSAILLAVALCLGAAAWLKSPRVRPPSPAPAADVPAPLPEARPAVVAFPTTVPIPASQRAGIPIEDAESFNELVKRVNNDALLTPADVEAAVGLRTRYPSEKLMGQLLLEMLLRAAHQQHGSGRTTEAISYLRRAMALPNADGRPRSALLGILLLTSDWIAIESHAREMVALDPRDRYAFWGLGYSLFRQDRNREAADALKTCLEVGEHPQARALLARIEKTMADERGMTEQQISHFHVRYDGDAHDDVGREILRGLERHYVTLVSALDHQPENAIPVILFSQQRYYDASGAPAWSGGAYDGTDGRIRLPIGGLTQSLTPDIDGTLVHELTHAFIADKSRGVAPREIHEGLAQYMEGERVASRLGAEGLTALARGTLGGIGGFYIEALSLVEYLMAVRGGGGMNDLLKAMGETGSVDEAFRQVYGASFSATKRAWRARLEQQYGS